MNVARPIRIIASISAVVAVALGMGTYTHANFTDIHMLFGLIVALALLVLAIMAVFTKGLARLGAICIVYAIIMPVFGRYQQLILPGDLHWLIETTHLAVGFGALALIGTLSTGLVRQQQTARQASMQPQQAQPQPIR
ncbi:MAG: hypothetical protein ACXWP6_19125 [Ktedonobacterales bacterium]